MKISSTVALAVLETPINVADAIPVQSPDPTNHKLGNLIDLMCAELAGDFHLGDSRQLTDKSLLPFDLVS